MEAGIWMVIDLDRCWGCQACEVACKQEQALGIGPRPMKVMDTGARILEGTLYRDFIPTLCQHCDDAACIMACPVESLYRETDGTVQIHQDLCIGCGACVEACPFGVMEMEEGKGKPAKCTLCRDRREAGGQPSCAQHCMGRAITVATGDEVAAIVDGRHYWSVGRIIYVSEKWVSLGAALRK